MPKTVDEYVEQYKALHVNSTDCLTPESAVLWYAPNSSMGGGGFAFLPDFGFLVCWLRYDLTTVEFESDSLPLWKYTEEELRQRRAAAEAGFDQLLRDFVQRGYTPEMGERLLKIAEDNFHEYRLDAVWVLPDDLDAMLDGIVGRPGEVMTWRLDDDEVASTTPFDLNNPVHRERLADRLNEPDY